MVVVGRLNTIVLKRGFVIIFTPPFTSNCVVVNELVSKSVKELIVDCLVEIFVVFKSILSCSVFNEDCKFNILEILKLSSFIIFCFVFISVITFVEPTNKFCCISISPLFKMDKGVSNKVPSTGDNFSNLKPHL